MDLSYSLSEVAFHTNGTLITGRGIPVTIKEILIDSRRLVHPESTLFVAIVSGRNNGHRYMGQCQVRTFTEAGRPLLRRSGNSCSAIAGSALAY